MNRRRNIPSHPASAGFASDSNVKLRLIGLLLLLAVLCLLFGLWLWIRTWPATRTADLGPSLLDQPYSEAAFQPTSTAADLTSLASQETEALLAKYPDTPAALSVAARKAYLLGETANAERAWQRALEIDPQFTEATYGLGLLAFESDQYAKAAQFFEDVSYRSPGDPRVPVVLAESLMHDGQVQQAILILEQHLSSEQASVQAWEQLGQAHLQDQNFQRAIVCFERVLEFSPDSQDAIYGLSRAYAATGNKEKAQQFNTQFRELAQRAREETAREANAFEDRGYAAHVAAQTYADAARVERTAGDLLAAQEALLRANQLEPRNPDYVSELQQVMLQLGKPREVVATTELLLEQAPESVDHWLTLGNAYAELNQADAAMQAFTRAIELDPKDERCQRAQQIIRRLRP